MYKIFGKSKIFGSPGPGSQWLIKCDVNIGLEKKWCNHRIILPKGECDTDTHTHRSIYIELNDFIPQGRQQKVDAEQTDPRISKKRDVTIGLVKKWSNHRISKKHYVTTELVKKTWQRICQWGLWAAECPAAWAAAHSAAHSAASTGCCRLLCNSSC